ncbi:MAG: pyridoxal phosphate-dependent aminotransferase [Alphaproteobacteria bacterium]|nr:pyridoxal phosphate-dependent aminotransferase [Alphaproteobacteria bacterium]
MAGLIEFSQGNPCFAFKAAARHALKVSDREMASYWNYSRARMAKLLGDSSDFLDQMGLKREGWDGVGPDCMAMTAGTTQGFAAILDIIAERFKKFCANTKRPQAVPVAILPVPTYGLFIEPLRKKGFEIVKIHRDVKNGWQLNLKELAHSLEEILHSENRIATVYFDSNPNNPLGLVRGEDETKILSEIIFRYNTIMERRHSTDQKWYDAYGPAFLRVIDDMVYYGLEYDEVRKPVSLMADERMFDWTYVLLGLSKIGLPAIRGGLVICNPNDAHKINLGVVHNCYQPNITAMKALQYAFSTGKAETREREAHLQKLREAHRYGELLMRSLIDGVEPSCMETPNGQRMIKDVAAITGGTQSAVKLLSGGVKELEVLTRPEAGFFHYVRLREGINVLRGSGLYSAPIECDFDLYELFKDHNIETIPGQWCGSREEDNYLRLSYALPAPEIVQGIVRMKKALHQARPR